MKPYSGFTLMELLIVIALIMILSVVGIGSFTQATIRSKDTQRKNDINQMVKAIESFYTDVGRYPLSLPDEDYLHCYIISGGVVTNPTCDQDRLSAIFENGSRIVYIDIPDDPEPSQDYIYVSDGNTYAFYAALESTSDRDLLKDGNGTVIPDPYNMDCGSAPCNYKVTETGLVKSL